MELSLLSFLSLGFLLGLKHATDADHVAAVTTFVTQEKSWLRSCWIGLFWGAGHTLSLALAGVAVILFKLPIPGWIESRLELVVAAMLVVLGIRGIRRVWNGGATLHGHFHRHGTAAHSHWHVHRSGDESHETWLHVGLRPLLTGIVHGAAGSGALMVLVLSSIQSAFVSLLYVVIFGAGSVVGMIVVSALVGLPTRWVSSRPEGFLRGLQMSASVLSCVIGIWLGVELLSGH